MFEIIVSLNYIDNRRVFLSKSLHVLFHSLSPATQLRSVHPDLANLLLWDHMNPVQSDLPFSRAP